MGFGITHNGWDWEALPSPEMRPVIEAEVGAVEHFDIPGRATGKWFSILGHGGMVTYSAESPEGPFIAATKNYAVLTGNCCKSDPFMCESAATLFSFVTVG
jgi:hypothetical protein